MSKCIFCGTENENGGNSTWPVFMDKDAESHRCCKECNNLFIIPARMDKTKIMNIRAAVGVEYEGDRLLMAGNYYESHKQEMA